VVAASPGAATGRTGPPREVGRITGTVTLHGRPVADVLIEPTSLEMPMLPIEEVAIVTDERGRFAYGFEAGEWKLTTSKRGFCPASITVVGAWTIDDDDARNPAEALFGLTRRPLSARRPATYSGTSIAGFHATSQTWPSGSRK
jgi:hypothetical protein